MAVNEPHKSDVAAAAGLLVAQAALAATTRLTQLRRSLRVSHGEILLLMALASHNDLSHAALADLLASPASTVTGMVRRLSDDGLVRVCVDAEDRREKRVSLTPAARETLLQETRKWREEVMGVLEHRSSIELKVIATVAQQVGEITRSESDTAAARPTVPLRLGARRFFQSQDLLSPL